MDTLRHGIICSSRAIIAAGASLLNAVDRRFLAKVGICVTAALAIDLVASRWKRIRPLTRWYLIHAAGNAAISGLVLPDTLHVTFNPIGALSGSLAAGTPMTSYRSYPVIIMSSMHLYHIVAYWRSMAAIDWIHHLVSGGVVGTACIFYIRGRIVNHGLFFMCGFPGMIDYLMLVGSDLGLIDRMTEKQINADINIWIRAPGILYTCFVAWICFLGDPTFDYNKHVSGALFLINIWNALYFAQRVVHNYGFHKGRAARLLTDEPREKTADQQPSER